MKIKYLISAILLLSGFFFSSCRKDYNCTCTVNGTTTVTDFGNEHKSNVKNSCDQMQKAAKIEDPAAKCTVEDAN